MLVMCFIALTSTISTVPENIIVQANQVSLIRIYQGQTVVETAGDQSFVVKESISEVMDIIESTCRGHALAPN